MVPPSFLVLRPKPLNHIWLSFPSSINSQPIQKSTRLHIQCIYSQTTSQHPQNYTLCCGTILLSELLELSLISQLLNKTVKVIPLKYVRLSHWYSQKLSVKHLYCKCQNPYSGPQSQPVWSLLSQHLFPCFSHTSFFAFLCQSRHAHAAGYLHWLLCLSGMLFSKYRYR